MGETASACGASRCRLRHSHLDRGLDAGVPEIGVIRPRRRVLVAEDDAALRRLLGTTLGSEHFEVIHAIDGEDALRVARQEQPALVLLEVNMPKLDGFEVCRHLKSEAATADIKVVLLSGRTAEEDRERGHAAGADEYFTKPFSPVQLLNRIYALLDVTG